MASHTVQLLLLAALIPWADGSAIASKFISRERIEEGVADCCPAEWADCCRQRLLRDQHILCVGLENETAYRMGICLEHHFYKAQVEIGVKHGNPVMEQKPHQCCWLLDGDECQERCYAFLRAPTMPPQQKMAFTDGCRPRKVLNASVDPGQLDCQLDRDLVLHTCFSVCLHWVANPANPTANDRFRPARDCAAYSKLMDSDSCLMPLHYWDLLEAVGNLTMNGTEEADGK